MFDESRWSGGLRAAVPGAAVLLVLSLVGLGRSAFWLDEAYSVAATNQYTATLVQTDANMAAYYALLVPWITIGREMWWIRLLSVLLAVGALLLLGRLATAIHGRFVATVCCLFAGSSWMLVRYAQEARAYTLVVLLAALSWILLDDLVEGRSSRWRELAYVAVATLLPLTHGLAYLVVVCQGLALALAGKVGRRVWLTYLSGAGSGAGIIAVILVVGDGGTGDGAPMLAPGSFARVIRSFTSPHPVLAAVVGGLVLYGVVLAVQGARRAPRGAARFRHLVPLFSGPAILLLVVVVSSLRPALNDRYAIGSVIGIALLMALAAARIALWAERKIQARSKDEVVRTVARHGVVGLAVSVLLLGQAHLHERPYDAWDQAAAVVEGRLAPGDALVFPESWLALPFEFAWESAGYNAQVEMLTPSRAFGSMRRFAPKLTASEVAEEVGSYRRIWVVHRGETDPSLSGTLARLRQAGFAVEEIWRWDGDVQGVQVVLLRR